MQKEIKIGEFLDLFQDEIFECIGRFSVNQAIQQRSIRNDDFDLTVKAPNSIVLLAVLGALGAYAGGAPAMRAALRVTFWGILEMALTAGVGRMFGAVTLNIP